ncbi:hypothetical protein LAZ67_1007473 [Cordylochernes scorpioides]|uniref:Uncharacterized protein n=1 Tax=Cordylochernes scorpioides TaxID=51811 RepID=A0ABY6K2B0_9ARAC|nr:hypothetical protein LAZ67_1007473 [Cordylochernes scorpioides]
MWTEVLVAVAVALVILVRYCRNGSKAGEKIPGTKSSCLRFNIMGLHYLWRNRNVIPPLSNVLHSTLGTSKIFQKEGVFQFWIGPRILIAVYKPEYMERSSFDQVSEFDRGRIVAYRDCGLSFREIDSRVGRNQTTLMRICDRWMQEPTCSIASTSVHHLTC